MLIGAVCIAVWVALGLLCGQVWIPLFSALGEFLLGYFAAYGGRRSDLGSYAAAQVLGFRRYAKRLPTEDVSRLMANDPDYFFNLAPFTLALGSSSPSPEPSAIGSWSGAHIWSPAPGTSRRRRMGGHYAGNGRPDGRKAPADADRTVDTGSPAAEKKVRGTP